MKLANTLYTIRTNLGWIRDALCYALYRKNPVDRALLNEKLSRIDTFEDIARRAKTISQMAHVQHRINVFMPEIIQLVPWHYLEKRQKLARRAFNEWVERRNMYIEGLMSKAAWGKYLYRGRMNREGDCSPSTARSYFSIAPDKRADIADDIAYMALEAKVIQSMFDYKSAKLSRKLWLPTIAPVGFKELVFTEYSKYVVEPEGINMLQYGDFWNKETLNVDDFLAERGWRRDQVSIRRYTGSRFFASLCDEAGNESQIQTNCVLVDFAEDLNLRVSTHKTEPPRNNSQRLIATWHEHEFLYYPASRPAKTKGKV